MSTKLQEFRKEKEYLICVDSDGCAMDTMDIKHIRCFGPCMVEEWGLSKWESPILTRWNEMNLYTMTRGINRFKGLAKALEEIHKTYCEIEDVDVLLRWVEESDELSNDALQRQIQVEDGVSLKKALSWSQKVNHAIDGLTDEEKRPFSGVKEALEAAHKMADVAIVSSANREAVMEEWEKYGLLDYVDVVLAQDTGSKAYGISQLLRKGYDTKNVMMVGDAVGDYEASGKNGIYFYPILVRKEKESWQEFGEKALEKLQAAEYGGEYQEKKVKRFMENLA